MATKIIKKAVSKLNKLLAKKSTKIVKKTPAKKTSKKRELPIEVVCIVDRSGSMGHLHTDVIGGLNTFIGEQKAVKGKANLTLVEFDTQYNILQEREDIQSARQITTADFVPRGGTALNDAIGKTVTKFDALKKDKKINKVIFCIMTDGQENASQEFRTKASVKALTERVQKDYNWEFVYLAANQDAFLEGSSYGFVNNTNFAPSSSGIRSATQSFAANTTRYRNSN